MLTWWQGRSMGGAGHGEGEDVIADTSYHVIARIHAGNGYHADQHAFTLTPQGTALITAYQETRRDLTSVGGARDGKVYDGIVQEIDVATGRVLFEWHSLDHVPLDESHQPAPNDANTPYDYFHINSVSLDHDGNLLISSRHTWTVYDVDRHTGHVLWRLGGKHSDFRLGPGLRFAWQHNPVSAGRDTLRIFDNESNGTPVRPHSRIITVRLDPQRKTATLVRSVEHPDGLSVPSQGNSQRLPERRPVRRLGPRSVGSPSSAPTASSPSTRCSRPAMTATARIASSGPATQPTDRWRPHDRTGRPLPSTPTGTARPTSPAGASWPAPTRAR